MTFYAAWPLPPPPEESFCEMVSLIERFIILVSKDGMEGNGE